jgi:hypothetical protein
MCTDAWLVSFGEGWGGNCGGIFGLKIEAFVRISSEKMSNNMVA